MNTIRNFNIKNTALLYFYAAVLQCNFILAKRVFVHFEKKWVIFFHAIIASSFDFSLF
jgi:hypothetical protein